MVRGTQDGYYLFTNCYNIDILYEWHPVYGPRGPNVIVLMNERVPEKVNGHLGLCPGIKNTLIQEILSERLQWASFGAKC